MELILFENTMSQDHWISELLCELKNYSYIENVHNNKFEN